MDNQKLLFDGHQFGLEFTPEQAMTLLSLWGYELEEETVTFSRNVYHNDTEEYTASVIKVYKDGEPAKTKYADGWGEFRFFDLGNKTYLQQVYEVFQREFPNYVFQFIMKQSI